jgi:hypothetical protein
MAKVRYTNGDPRDLKLRVIAAIPTADLGMNATYIRQFRTQVELSNELSPYFDVLGQSFLSKLRYQDTQIFRTALRR